MLNFYEILNSIRFTINRFSVSHVELYLIFLTVTNKIELTLKNPLKKFVSNLKKRQKKKNLYMYRCRYGRIYVYLPERRQSCSFRYAIGNTVFNQLKTKSQLIILYFSRSSKNSFIFYSVHCLIKLINHHISNSKFYQKSKDFPFFF